MNLRRLSRQIYSLIPLTTREPHLVTGADTPNRTEDILITSEMLYQLSYIGQFFEMNLITSKRPEDNSRVFRFYQALISKIILLQ